MEQKYFIEKEKIKVSRIWAMPNSNTFEIKPIRAIIEKYLKKDFYSVDPFANRNALATVTNDLDPQFKTDYHLDAYDFLKEIKTQVADLVLFDPPYSPYQIAQCYKKFNKTVNFKTTSNDYWSRLKKEISRIVKPKGIVITCGWNSGGVGINYGFDIIELLLVPHGSWHNDTIVTVERKDRENDKI